jgi:hypothetical protein
MIHYHFYLRATNHKKTRRSPRILILLIKFKMIQQKSIIAYFGRKFFNALVKVNNIYGSYFAI